MNCLMCQQAEIIDGQVRVLLKRDEMQLTVNQVPAQVCLSCGEAYVEEDVAVRLLHGAETFSAAGEIDSSVEYSTLR
ncbi:MAG TPA: YgiT-type zinc finger protein [Anaerolineales bacterium]|nr:YgiT-type zinc finger protein [Anaerolineales bacterium]